jgi:hypothetical protein
MSPLATFFHAVFFFFALLSLLPWIWRRHVLPKRRLTFIELHIIMSRKIEFFTIYVSYQCLQFTFDLNGIFSSTNSFLCNKVFKERMEKYMYRMKMDVTNKTLWLNYNNLGSENFKIKDLARSITRWGDNIKMSIYFISVRYQRTSLGDCGLDSCG